LIEAAKKEYDGVIEEFLATGERLFGPYVWGRCGITLTEVIVKPSPCFPLSLMALLLFLLSRKANFL
jgi:hypothetical protein